MVNPEVIAWLTRLTRPRWNRDSFLARDRSDRQRRLCDDGRRRRGRCPRRHVDADHHGTQSTQLAAHVEALKAAGFAEVGTLWQRGDNRLLCAVLPPG